MKRSRKKLIMGKGVKTEGEEARNIIVQSSGSSLSNSKPSSTKKPSSIFLSPSTGKEFSLLEEVIIDKNKKTDPDSLSLDNISVSNLLPALETSLNSEMVSELLSTPQSKFSSNEFSQFNIPTCSTSRNTDGNIKIFQTPTSKRKSVRIGVNEEENSDHAIESSLGATKQVKLSKFIVSDIESDDDEIFDIVPKKKRNPIATQVRENQLDLTTIDNTVTTDIEAEQVGKYFVSSNRRKKNQEVPSLQVNVNIEHCSSDESSVHDNSSNLDNTSDSDTFDEIYDSESGSSSSTEEENIIEDEDEWTDIPNTIQTNFASYPLRSQINIPPNVQLSKPFDYYKLFVTNELIEKMVVETNKHAEEYISSHAIKPKSRLNNWHPVTFDEMEKFMGVLMVMGINKLPNLHLYWSKKKCYRNEYIVNLMTRDRFLLLLKFWHFSDNFDNGDKLYKIRNVLDILSNSFTEILRPGRFMVIDETMIAWKGRLKFRQYIKNKAHKYGIKLYKLCTPEGYTYSIIVYTGKDDEKSGAGHGHDIVLRLTNNLLEEGRTLIADNFYTSVTLAEELLKKNTLICGTVRNNRKGLPKTFISTKLKKGQVIGTMNKKGVKIIKWMDKRPVTMLTTVKEHNATLKDTGRLSRISKQPIMKPASVMMYNENKKGVDFSDQMTAYYSTLKRGLKWFRKLIMSLLFGTCLVNAWIVHKMKNEDQLPLLTFLESIIESMTKTSFTDPNSNEQKKRIIHTLIKADKFKKCHSCYQDLRKMFSSRETDKKVKKVRTFCKECEKPMCLECYNKVHDT